MTPRVAARSAAALSPLSERDFMRQVTDLAGILGWSHVHFRPAETRRGWRTPVEGPLGEGWPDLVLVRERDRRLIFAELKSQKGVVSDRQAEVLELLRSLVHDRYGARDALGFGVLAFPQVEVHLWRPADLDAIAAVLA